MEQGGARISARGGHLSFRSSAMADQDDIWGGCPRPREVLASDEVNLDLHTAATKLWVIGVGIGVDRLAKKPTVFSRL